MENILDSIYTFFRGFGFFTLTFSYILGFLLSQKNMLKLGNFLIIDQILNFSLKNIFKNILGDKNYPIIGNGMRPPDAISCSFFLPRKPVTKKTKSYGMPSGHSQTFSFISTLISLHLKNKYNEYNYKSIILFILTISAMMMRIYIEKCHTYQQVIAGALIGMGLAHLMVKYYGNPFDVQLQKEKCNK